MLTGKTLAQSMCYLPINVQYNGISSISRSFLCIIPKTKGGLTTFVLTLLFLVKDPKHVR